MIVSPEKIILGSEYHIKNFAVFLITGSEETLCKKIEEEIINYFQKEGFVEIKRFNATDVKPDNINKIDIGLFSQKNILIYENPKEIDVTGIIDADYKDKIIIINHKKLKNTAKLKRDFVVSKKLLSVSCYKLSKESKRLCLENILKKYNTSLEKDAFWYLLENSSDSYSIFESEIIKIINYGDKKIGLKEISVLLSKAENNYVDNLFFNILGSSKGIFILSQKNIYSLSDCYIILERAKFFFSIISKSKDLSEAENNFPRYLFKEKSNFFLLFQKINKKKLITVYALIKKTEFLLRKSSNMYLPITQRFLSNLKKTVN